MSYHFVRIDQSNADDYSRFCPREQLDAAIESGKLARAAGLTDSSGTPIAAAIGLLEEDAMWVPAFFVDQNARNRGAGALLLNGMIALAVRSGRQTVYFQYPFPEQRELELFLIRSDFQVDDSQRIFHCPMSSLQAALDALELPPVRGKIAPLHQLPVEQQVEWKSRLGRDIPAITAPEAIPGSPCPDACLALVQNGKVVGHTACTWSKEDSVGNLGAIYLQPEASDEEGLALLCGALRALCRTGAETFSFAAGSQAECQLMEFLGQTLKLTWEEEVYHTAVLVRKTDRQLEQQDARELSWVELMPRMNSMLGILRFLKLEPRLETDPERGPFLALEQEGLTLRLSYIRLGDASADRFLLSALLEIPFAPEEQESAARRAAMAAVTSPGPIVDFRPDLGRTILRSTLPEAGPIPTPETVQLFLDLIRDAAAPLLPSAPETR